MPLNASHIHFSSPAHPGTLRVVQGQGSEWLSRCFEFTIDLAVGNGELQPSLSALLNQPAVLELGNPVDDSSRPVHGIITQMSWQRRDDHYTHYQAVLRPSLWRLTQRSNCRIFQFKSVPEVVEEVLKAAGFSADDFQLTLQHPQPEHDYLVQYHETDLAFISRLLAEAGIWSFFDHTEARHTLVLTDTHMVDRPVTTSGNNDSFVGRVSDAVSDILGLDGQVPFHAPGNGVADVSHISAFAKTQQLHTTRTVQTDYDFTRPNHQLETAFDGESELLSPPQLEQYQPYSRYDQIQHGDKLSQYRQERAQCYQHAMHGRSNVVSMQPGYQFQMKAHLGGLSRDQQGQRYRLTKVEHRFHQPQVLEHQASQDLGVLDSSQGGQPQPAEDSSSLTGALGMAQQGHSLLTNWTRDTTASTRKNTAANTQAQIMWQDVPAEADTGEAENDGNDNAAEGTDNQERVTQNETGEGSDTTNNDVNDLLAGSKQRALGQLKSAAIRAVSETANQAGKVNQPFGIDDVQGKTTQYENTFHCIPNTMPYRPPQLSKGRVKGLQTAVVVGPEGEEIYIDNHGRVKVQFHWDRYGSSDEHSSCWVRVNHSWGGAAWGGINHPRVGHEVIVDFIEGDPDRPMVTGRVYHATNVPPYPLPQHKTRSTLKSDSHKEDGYNEIRLEDEYNREELYQHAQKDLTIKTINDKNQKTRHDETLFVGNNRHKQIKVDQEEDIGLSQQFTVGKNYTETVGGDQKGTVAETFSGHVEGHTNTHVGASGTYRVGDTIYVDVADDITIQSGTQIQIGTGSSKITLMADGTVHVNGVDISVDGAVSRSAPVTLQITGGAPASNPPPHLPPPIPAGKAVWRPVWSDKKHRITDDVEAIFLVSGFSEGETATVTVKQINEDDSIQTIATVSEPLSTGRGEIRVVWNPVNDLPNAPLVEKASSDSDEELMPLTFFYEVEVSGVQADEVSPPLLLSKDYTIDLKDKDSGEPLLHSARIKLESADGVSHGQVSQQGVATFKDITLGVVRLTIYDEDYYHNG